MQEPETVKINRVIDEADDIKSFMFNHRFKEQPTPGQFLMAWLPGVDEIPLALSYIASKKQQEFGVTVANVGTATGEIHLMKTNDVVGLRGPYGNGFSLEDAKRILVVGGGIGMAPLAPTVEAARQMRKYVQVLVGAKTASGLLFDYRMREANVKVHITTDDGSAGQKGFVTDLVEDQLEKNNYDLVLGCGPETMLVKLVDMCNSREIAVQVSLERYMKCGLGICDSCAINGFHVCKDGPVFEGDLLAKIEDFGKYKRDATGRKIGLNED
jgi:dihydroorotate dehydrogenase electron transfer subunit